MALKYYCPQTTEGTCDRCEKVARLQTHGRPVPGQKGMWTELLLCPACAEEPGVTAGCPCAVCGPPMSQR